MTPPPPPSTKVGKTKTARPRGRRGNQVALEEDDDFEEFPADDYATAGPNTEKDKDKEVKVWEDNWDDDNVEEDFSSKLRKETVEMEIRGRVKTGSTDPPPTKKKK